VNKNKNAKTNELQTLLQRLHTKLDHVLTLAKQQQPHTQTH